MKKLIVLFLFLSVPCFSADYPRPVTRFQYPAWAQVGQVGCWYFNASTGSYNGTAGEIVDSSGNGYGGQVSGACNCGGGYINGGLYANGAHQSYAAMPVTASSLRIATGSWGCWFKPVTGGALSNSFFTMPFDNDSWNTPYISYSIYYGVDSGNYLTMATNIEGTYKGGDGLYRFTSLDTWHYVLCTWDGSYRKLYFDGVLVVNDDYHLSGGNITYGTPNPQLTFCNASVYQDNSGQNVSVDSASVWNIVLSSVQARQLYEWGMGD